MEWWQALIIVTIAGVIIDHMVCNICRAYIYGKGKKENGDRI